MSTDHPFERRHEFIDLSLPEINDLVSPTFGSDALVSAQPLSGGRVNSNYALTLRSQPAKAVLRVYARGGAPRRLESQILQLLEGRVPVPKVLLDGSKKDPAFLVLSWVEGQTLDNALRTGIKETTSLATDIGTILAAIHAQTFTDSGFLGKDMQVIEPIDMGAAGFHTFAQPALAGRAGVRLGAERLTRLNELISWAAPYLDKQAVQPCLVHSDFNPPNLMVHDGRVTGVMGWEYAHAGNRLTDIANMLRTRDFQPPEFNDAFVSAYEAAAGPLPQDWPSLSRIIDLLSQLEMLDGPDERPAIFIWAIERIDDTIRFVEDNLT